MRNVLFAALLTLLLTACYHSTGVEEPISIITQVEDSNNADFIRESPKAMAANGDYYISNNYLEVVVDGGIVGERRQNFLAPTGGTIIDVSSITVNSLLQRLSYENDNLNQIFQVVNGNLGTPVAYTSIRIETLSDDLSSIRLTGAVMDRDGTFSAAGMTVDPVTKLVAGLVVETVYTIERSTTYLLMSTTLTNTGSTTAPVSTIGDYVFMGGNSLRPFIPAPGYGYCPEGAADTPVYVPYVTFDEHVAPYQTLGIFSPDDGVMQVTFDSNRGDYERSGGTFVTISKPALPTDVLPAGGAVTFVRKLHPELNNNPYNNGTSMIGELTQVTGNARNIFQETGQVTGVVSHNMARDSIIVTAEQIVPGTYFNGREMVSSPVPVPMAVTRLVDTSVYSFILPPGRYQMRIFGNDIQNFVATSFMDYDAGDPEVEGDETYTEEPFDIVTGSLLSAGEIEFETDATNNVETIINDENGDIFRGRASVFHTDDGSPLILGSPEGGENGGLNHFMLYYADREIRMPLGDYRVVLSHGPLYDAQDVAVSVTSTTETDEEGNETTTISSTPETVEATLTRQVDPGSYLSFDPVVRSSASYNCSVASLERIMASLAEDLNVVMLSDINTNRDPEVDYFNSFERRYENETGDGISLDSNALQILYGATVKSLYPKAELPAGFGEFVVFPIDHEVGVRGFGVGETGDRRFATILDNLRNRYGYTIYSMMRRPRGTDRLPNGVTTGLFDALNEAVPADFDNPYFDKTSELGTGTTNDAFEMMEVLSGTHYDEYLAVRLDWFNALNHGVLKWAGGGSGHTWNAPQFVGSPRTWVHYTETSFNEDTFLAAFASGQSFVSTGPILDVTVGENVPGSTVSASGGQVTLNISVRAADWIPVEELRVIVGGEVVHRESLASASGVTRFSGNVTVDVPETDSFIVVECGASLENIAAGAFPQERFAEIYPGVQPIAFTNPFLVDRDGDGSWQ